MPMSAAADRKSCRGRRRRGTPSPGSAAPGNNKHPADVSRCARLCFFYDTGTTTPVLVSPACVVCCRLRWKPAVGSGRPCRRSHGSISRRFGRLCRRCCCACSRKQLGRTYHPPIWTLDVSIKRGFFFFSSQDAFFIRCI